MENYRKQIACLDTIASNEKSINERKQRKARENSSIKILFRFLEIPG